MRKYLRPRYLIGAPLLALTGLVALGIAVGPPPAPLPPSAPLAAATAIPPTTPAPAAIPTLTVTHVADGDTVGLSDGRKIRILGIDTPESVKPNAPVDCYGLEASAFAKATLLGQPVTAPADPTQDATDRYGRTLAYVVLADGRDYSVMAAEAGMARSYIYNGRPVAKHPQIVAAEQRAKDARRGLWGACTTPAATPAAVPPKPTAPSKAPAPPPATQRQPAAASGGSYPNCAAARAAGAAPLHRGQTGYSTNLDRDGDGIACE